MARPRTVSDEDIHAAVCHLLAAGGDKAVSFSAAARASRLAPPTLVQRFGSREGMIHAALAWAWDGMDRAAEAAAAEAKPAGYLKALGATAVTPELLSVTLRDPVLRARAEAWRQVVEDGLAERMSGHRAREAASQLFAAWQGQVLWQALGGRGFRLKDAAKRLA